MVCFVAGKTMQNPPNLWEFAYVSGLPFLFPHGEGTVTMTTFDGYGEAEIPKPIAGIITTALAYVFVIDMVVKHSSNEDEPEPLVGGVVELNNMLRNISAESLNRLKDMRLALLEEGRKLATIADISFDFGTLTD